MVFKIGRLFLILLTVGMQSGLLAQQGPAADSLDQALVEIRDLMYIDPAQAMSRATTALETARRSGIKQQEALAGQLLARMYAEQGNYVSALETGLEALRLFEELGDQKSMCVTYIHLGVIYRYQVQYAKSIEYYQKAEAVALSHNYDTLKAAIWGNMGNIYFDQGDFDQSLQHHRKSLEIDQAFGNLRGMGNSYYNIGLIYRTQKHYEQALDYLNRSLAIDQEQGDQRNICISYIGFMETYVEMGNYHKALSFAEKAMEFAEVTQSDRLKSQVLEYLPLIHATLGHTDRSLAYFKTYRQLSDSLQAAALSGQIAEMQTKYETDQKEKEISLQNLRLETQGSAIKQQRLFIAALFGFLLLASLVAFLLFNRFKLKQRNRRLELENEQINLSKDLEQRENLDQMKSRFFANISHEFRTPLNLILAPLENDRPEISENEIGMMRRNARRLLRLVNQLLDLARIEGGMVKTAYRQLEISSFVKSIAQSFMPLADSRSIRYQVDIPERDYVVSSDPDKLEKVVYNLLSNAFKFTPEGGTVSIQLAIQRPDALRLVVSDTGIGIVETMQEKIFDRFYQVDNSSTRAYEGTGIGLALIKELVELLNGAITLDSQEGKGSVFTIQLPVVFVSEDQLTPDSVITDISGQNDPAEIEVLSPSGNSDNAPFLTGKLPVLLLVEDNQDLRNYMSSQMTSEYQVLEAENGKKGLELARERIPDLVVTDIMMPEMDGVSLTKKLREDEKTSHIPILLLTARDDGETKIKGFETGAEQYLVKPFRLEELKARLNALLNQREVLRQKFGREVTLQPEAITLNDRDADFLKSLISIIEKNMENEEFSVEKLQLEIGMSRMQLHRKLKALVDQSTSEFIRSIKLKRAAQVLQQPGIQITEAAYQSGFNHLSYFARCFKDQFGVSPSEYVKNLS